MEVWVKRELDGANFPDQRLKARLGKLLSDFGQRIGGTVPMACQDWAATKAAYRFFDNSRVDEATILAGHFAATKTRFSPTTGPVLVLHDTTEFSFQRDAPDGIAGQGNTTIAKKMARQPIRGSHDVQVRDDHGCVSTARVCLRFCKMTILGPLTEPPLHGLHGLRPQLEFAVNARLVTNAENPAIFKAAWEAHFPSIRVHSPQVHIGQVQGRDFGPAKPAV